MKKNLFKILFITSFFYLPISKAYAAVESGPATEYKVTITKIELCETGSTTALCLSPVTVSSGSNLGVAMDIAAVLSGEAVGTVGNFGLATVGKTYNVIQTTMDRSIVITGDSGNCTTSGGNGTLTTNATGGTGTAASKTLYVPLLAQNDTYIAINGVQSSDGSGSQDEAGAITTGHNYFESRNVLTAPFTLKPGGIPTVSVAFSTATAVTHADNGTCGNAAMYATPPTVTITIN
jgi:hypothetical protein|tara:strand:- start:63 stop:767 length:705 start_codon:yes stop_codon:yes gene_type:complete